MPSPTQYLPLLYGDLVLNALFRGTFGTPPTTIYAVMGQGVSLVAATALSGVARKPYTLGRVQYGSVDNYYYESAGTGLVANNYSGVSRDTALILHMNDTGIEGLTTKIYVMLYDALTAGNLLAVASCEFRSVPVSTLSPAFPEGIVLELWGLGTTSLAGGEFTSAVVCDWLLRGYDSMNVRMNTTDYANLYIWLPDYYNPDNTYMPRQAVARSTASWSAPATYGDGSGVRYISNTNTITIGPATAATSILSVQFRLSNTVQSTPDIVAQCATTPRVIAIGDSISFAPGTLEMAFWT